MNKSTLCSAFSLLVLFRFNSYILIVIHSTGVVAFIFMILLVECYARPLYPLPSKTDYKNRQPLQTFRPYNIAHRGSNGEIPEETAAAYMVSLPVGVSFLALLETISLF